MTPLATEAQVAEAIRQAYADAIACQNASNLSGVVHTMSKHMGAIWAEVRANGGGTDDVNRHPAVQLFLCKLVSLTGGEFEPGCSQWTICESRAKASGEVVR